jgi:hypothetical protein
MSTQLQPSFRLLTTNFQNDSTAVLTTSRTWDFGQRLRTIKNVAGGVTVTSHDFLYDRLNRRTEAYLEDRSIWKYDYNDRDELTAGERYWSD